jgi:hypothetical protein
MNRCFRCFLFHPGVTALQPGCNFGMVKPDALIARNNNLYLKSIQNLLTSSSEAPGFGAIFNGTEPGKLFSTNTVKLSIVTDDAATYLGHMKEVLDNFRRQAEDANSRSERSAIEADVVCGTDRALCLLVWAPRPLL